MTLFKKTATELQSLLHNREVSVKELTQESVSRIATKLTFWLGDGDVSKRIAKASRHTCLRVGCCCQAG